MALITLFSQYLRHIPVPIPAYSIHKKLQFTRVYIFQILPVGALFSPRNKVNQCFFPEAISLFDFFFFLNP